jgi:hypothetical protein
MEGSKLAPRSPGFAAYFTSFTALNKAWNVDAKRCETVRTCNARRIVVLPGAHRKRYIRSARHTTGHRPGGAASLVPGGASMSLLDPEFERSPLQRVPQVADTLGSAVVARWRGIVLLFILFFTIWLAIQVFFGVRYALSYLGDNLPTLNEIHKQLPSVDVPPTGARAILPPPITNCWRDRSLGSDCFKTGGPEPRSRRTRALGPEPPRLSPRFRSCRCFDI